VKIYSPVSPYGVDESEFRQRQEYVRGAYDEPQVVRSDVRHVGQLRTSLDAQLEVREHRAGTCARTQHSVNTTTIRPPCRDSSVIK